MSAFAKPLSISNDLTAFTASHPLEAPDELPLLFDPSTFPPAEVQEWLWISRESRAINPKSTHSCQPREVGARMQMQIWTLHWFYSHSKCKGSRCSRAGGEHSGTFLFWPFLTCFNTFQYNTCIRKQWNLLVKCEFHNQCHKNFRCASSMSYFSGNKVPLKTL